MLELDLASSWTREDGKTQVMVVARQKLLQNRLVLEQLVSLKCVRGEELLVSYCCSRGLGWKSHSGCSLTGWR